MRILIQRVSEARVTVGGEVVGEIAARDGRSGPVGLALLVGVGGEDTEAVLEPMARKVVNLRIFPDEDGKMNRSLLDAGGEILAVSQFTLYADCRKGRRPSFLGAAPPELGERLFNGFVDVLRAHGPRVATGRFGAMMDVALVNHGPVTIWLDSEQSLA